MKRVALIGNVNNNFFAIARHLRDMGYDAHLFYRASLDHFLPQADTYREDYAAHSTRVKWLDKGLFGIDEKEIADDLNGFDFYIGQGDEAAAAYRAGFIMDVYYPYGSDVYKYAYLKQEFSFAHRMLYYFRERNISQVNNTLRKGTASKSMRGAIANARNVLVEFTNDDFEQKIKGLACKGEYHNVPMPFIYDKEYHSVSTLKTIGASWESKIQKLRADNELMILYHGRQEWKTKYNEFTPKNTHHLIIGFAGFIKKNPGTKCALIMLEYGHDLVNSKMLVNELGIEANVTWLPKMYRKEIMYLISKMDVCCGEFGRSYLTFGTIVESMLMSKPVIHYRDDRLYEQFRYDLYPLLNAREPEEIERQITYAYNNPGELKRIGLEANAWVQQHFIRRPLEKLADLIESN
jgi:glycosyltransferase involved in cell wall biosynthesis